MCSELLRIPNELSGVPLLGAGLLLGVWLVVGVVLLVTQGWSPALKSYTPTWLIVGVAIALLPRMFPQGIPIMGYGAMVFLGAVLGLYLAVRRANQQGLDAEIIFSLAFWMFVAGIVGARAFYVLEYWEDRIVAPTAKETLLNIINFPQGGLVVYGALVGASAAFLWFVRSRHLPALAIADMIAPSLLAGLALGRLGCLLNGCCFGGPSSDPWAIAFPEESPPYETQVASGRMHGFQLSAEGGTAPVRVVQVDPPLRELGLEVGAEIVAINDKPIQSLASSSVALVEAHRKRAPLEITTSAGREVSVPAAPWRERSLPVQPAQVFSAIHAGLLAWFLWEFYAFRRRDGEVLAAMLTLYPITRFILETIRTDEAPVFSTGLSISQNVSIVLLLGAMVLWFVLSRRPLGFAYPRA